MVDLEREINRFVLGKNVNGLNEALRSYKELILSVVKTFKVPKGETGNLFHMER